MCLVGTPELPHTVGCVTVDAIACRDYDRLLSGVGPSLIDEELVKRGVRMRAHRRIDGRGVMEPCWLGLGIPVGPLREQRRQRIRRT